MKIIAIVLLLSLSGCVSYVSPIDRIILNTGCDDSIQRAIKAENDPNCSSDVLDILRNHAERAKYLKNWANGGGFPIGALEALK